MMLAPVPLKVNVTRSPGSIDNLADPPLWGRYVLSYQLPVKTTELCVSSNLVPAVPVGRAVGVAVAVAVAVGRAVALAVPVGRAVGRLVGRLVGRTVPVGVAV